MIRIERKTIGYIAIVFPFVKPGVFDQVEQLTLLDNAYNLGKVVAIITLLFMMRGIKRKWTSLSLLLGAYLAEVVLMTFVRQGSYYELIVAVTNIICMYCLVLAASTRGELFLLTKGIISVLEFNLIINMISILIYRSRGGMFLNSPGIMKNTYYLGYDNLHIIYILPYLILSIYYDLESCKRVRLSTIVKQAAILTASFLLVPATIILSVCLFYFLTVYTCCSSNKLLNEYTVIVTNIVICLFAVVGRMYTVITSATRFIFNKDLNSVRQQIWTLYLIAINRQYKWLGHGFINGIRRKYSVGIIHAHNMYLDVVYETGIIGLVLFLTIIFVCLKRARKDNVQNKGVFIAGIMSYMIAFQVEAYDKMLFFLMLIIMFFINDENSVSKKPLLT